MAANRGEKVWRFVWLAFLVNKVLVLVPAFLAIRRALPAGDWLTSLHILFIDNFYKWDSGWYGIIAEKGYDLKASAFFPLLPLCMAVVHTLLGLSIKAAGVLVSHVAFVLLLYVVYKLVRLDYEPPDARKVVWLLVLYPTSYYFSAAYTESLFMLFLTLCLYAIRREKWAGAGVSGFLASVTRNTGVFLTIPFVLEYLGIVRWRDFLALGPRMREAWQARGWGRFFWVLAIPLPFFLYMAYLKAHFHDPLAFSHAQSKYGRGVMNPLLTLVHGYKLVLTYMLTKPFDWFWGYFFVEFFVVTLTLLILLTGLRALRVSYWVILLYAFLIPISAPAHGAVKDYFVSYSRYSLVIFPLFPGLYALVKRHRLFYGLSLIVFAGLLVILVYAWSRNKWVA